MRKNNDGSQEMIRMRAAISIFFGMLGFFVNFLNIQMIESDSFKLSILLGLIFPLIITMAWGWRYGLLSALAGGCQTMWWLWREDGYGMIYAVPVFTLWIIWHGYWADRRHTAHNPPWYYNSFIVEIPFRFTIELGFFTLFRWLVSLNPPPWNPAITWTTVPRNWCITAAIKHTMTACLLLLAVHILLSITPVRRFFHLKKRHEEHIETIVYASALLLGAALWVVDSAAAWLLFNPEGHSFWAITVLNVEPHTFLERNINMLVTLTAGVIIARFIVARVRAENALSESEQRYAAYITSSPIPILATDEQGNLKDVNPAACHITGYTQQELLSRNIYGIIHTEEDEDAVPTLELNKNDTWEKEYSYRTRQGDKRFCKISTVRLSPARFLIFAVDLTERKATEDIRNKLQEQLNQVQKMESIGQLAGGIAHDFNNKLMAITGFTELAQSKMASNTPATQYLTEVQRAARHAAALTRQLLTFARKETIAPRRLLLNDVVSQMTVMLQRIIGEAIELIWKPAPALWTIKMDSGQMDQIVTNLCINARDAIENVGTISIETANITIDDEYCTRHAGFTCGDYVLLMVSDTGCGMSREVQEKAFEPFFTTKPVGKGTGLGLATVYGIVKQNHGFINIYSEPGTGSTFRIYLPRVDSKADENQQNETPQIPKKTKHEIIMLVEDDPAVLKLTSTILNSDGYTLITAPSPKKACRLAEQFKGEIHLLITDVVMPEMNGQDLTNTLQKLYPQIRTLFMSSFTADIITHNGVLAEGVHFLQKPFSKSDLTTKVHEMLID